MSYVVILMSFQTIYSINYGVTLGFLDMVYNAPFSTQAFNF
jgi:hypothetical protein